MKEEEDLGEIGEVFWEYSTEDMIGKLLEMVFTEREIIKALSAEIKRTIKEWYEK